MIKEMYQHETVFYSFICITYFLSMNSWLMRLSTKCIWLTKEEKCVIFAPKSVIIVVSVFRLSHAMNYTLPLERNNNDMIFGTSVDMYPCLTYISLFVFVVNILLEILSRINGESSVLASLIIRGMYFNHLSTL